MDTINYSNRSHLKVQLIESPLDVLPQISNCSSWNKFDDSPYWYSCSNQNGDMIVINRYSDRVWAAYSLMKIKYFSKIMEDWVTHNLDLDYCWLPPSHLKNIGKRQSWKEKGIGIKYNDILSDETNQSQVSLKAWFGSNRDILDSIEKLSDKFAISSLRFKDYETSTVSEWYSSGKITFNASDDIQCVFKAINDSLDIYDSELKTATKLRDYKKGSFEFEFTQKIDLNAYSETVKKGKSDLKLWMTETESAPDFKRFRGVDMHTWDRIFLDLGSNYAYMTVPGKGCVNAAPRLVTVQGETLMGKTQVYYNGDEIFVQ